MHLKLHLDTALDPLHIEFTESNNSHQFLQLLSSHAPVPDQIEIMGGKSAQQAMDEFLAVAKTAPKLFGHAWDLDHPTQENFNLWHKDIEYITQDQISTGRHRQKRMDLFLKLHRTLHTAENALVGFRKRVFRYDEPQPLMFYNFKWLGPGQPRWRDWPDFSPQYLIQRGDVVAEFPVIGKSPEWCMNDGDNLDLASTCRLPLAVAPAFNIVITPQGHERDYLQQRSRLRRWYAKHRDQLEPMFTEQELLSTMGVMKLGRVKNLQELDRVTDFIPSQARVVEIQTRDYLARALAN